MYLYLMWCIIMRNIGVLRTHALVYLYLMWCKLLRLPLEATCTRSVVASRTVGNRRHPASVLPQRFLYHFNNLLIDLDNCPNRSRVTHLML